MIHKFKDYILNEGPNIVHTKDINLTYDDNDAIPFGMLNNKIYVGNYGEMHFHMYTLAHQRKLTKNEGRIWVNSKIISFYTPYPEPDFMYNYLKKIEYLINKKHSIKLNFFTSNWKIDFTDIKNEFIKNKISVEHTPDLIPLNSYRYYWDNIKNLDIEREEHVKVNMNKKKDVPFGFGSRNPKYMDKRKWQQASLTDENYKMNENPDYVINNIANYKSKNNNYAFGYYNGKMLVGNKTHYDIYSLDITRDEFLYAGRIWLSEKIISFWDYPDKNIIKKVIDDLSIALRLYFTQDNIEELKYIREIYIEEYKHIDIWNIPEFKLEIIDDDGKNKIILLKDYIGSEDLSDNEKSIKHLDTTTKHTVPYGYGSKSSKYKSLAYRQAIYVEKFNDFNI